MSEDYSCSYCSKSFEHRKSHKNHERYCGMTRLSDYHDSGNMRELEGMSQALRSHEYDKSADSGRKTRQKTIRNKEVNY